MTSSLKLVPCFTLALFFLSPAVTLANELAFDPDHMLYDIVLKEFVTEGLVDYAELQKNPHSLKRYLTDLSRVTEPVFKGWENKQQLAFLINLYNAATLKLIVNHYPVNSIKDIGSLFKGPWHQPIITLFGKSITLNRLEHRIIRRDYDEPRIHLALVCGAKGCPQLRSEAYTGEKLNRQLDNQAKVFLNSHTGMQIDRQNRIVYAASIFKWYGKDFVSHYTPESGFKGFNKTERAVLNFCSQYLSEEDHTYLAASGYSLKYQDYDWSLNEKEVKK